jgi:hypothetical protein
MIKRFEMREEVFTELAKPLLQNDLFVVGGETIYEATSSFGSSYIVLQSKNGLKIEFIADNKDQTISANILFAEESYDLEDLFKMLNIMFEVEKEDFLKMIKNYSEVIYKNKDKIFMAFDEAHKDETIKKMNCL